MSASATTTGPSVLPHPAGHATPATTAPIEVPEALARVYVWDVVVRVTHWVIVLSLIVLSVTGIYIGRPFLIAAGPAGEQFVMGTVKAIHSYSAIAFTLAVLARIWWMFTGSRHARWWNFVPIHAVRRKGLWGTFLFYTFIRPKPPPFVGHNPLAGASYMAVFGLYLVMIVTGLGLYGASANVSSPLHYGQLLLWFFGGAQNARWFHHIVMWLLIGFTIHHVYSALLVAHIEKNGTLDSIFSGFKFVPRSEAEADAKAEAARRAR
jgi:Ni/Fe-hydrogenase 1 B-type cytochrome subunit